MSAAEYERRADVWPLNPAGDLIAIVMIESAEGLRNVDAPIRTYRLPAAAGTASGDGDLASAARSG